MQLSTANIDCEHLENLGKLAGLDKRSKTQELHFLIDQELKARGF